VNVYTCVQGKNADLIADVCRLYLPPGSKVADVTFGKGLFWGKFDLTTIDFHPSDKFACQESYDFAALPYKDREFDVVVLDPPYAHDPGKMIVDAAYRNAESCRGRNHDDIIELYRGGMLEAYRILKPGGYLWVKCQDEIDQSIQRWSHLEIALIAQGMQLYIRDLFVLMQTAKPAVQHRQQHARKNHSYLWVFEKVPTTDRRLNIQRVSP
jgi:hypothetical protein